MTIYGRQRYPVKRQQAPLQIQVTDAGQEYVRIRALVQKALAYLESPDALPANIRELGTDLTTLHAAQMGAAKGCLQSALMQWEGEDEWAAIQAEQAHR